MNKVIWRVACVVPVLAFALTCCAGKIHSPKPPSNSELSCGDGEVPVAQGYYKGAFEWVCGQPPCRGGQEATWQPVLGTEDGRGIATAKPECHPPGEFSTQCERPVVKLSRPPVGSKDDPDMLSLDFRCSGSQMPACDSYEACKENVGTSIRYRYTVGDKSWNGEWTAADEQASVREVLGLKGQFTSCLGFMHDPEAPSQFTCHFGTSSFVRHIVDSQRSRGLVGAGAGTLVLEGITLDFPGKRPISLSADVFPKIVQSFTQKIGLDLKPHAELAKACVGDTPEKWIERCSTPRARALRTNTQAVRKAAEVSAKVCSQIYSDCERSAACDADGFAHGRQHDYVRACSYDDCVRMDEDDAAFARAEVARCENPAQEQDCAPLVRYVHSLDNQFYLECKALKPFHGFHWSSAQATLEHGLPQCEKLMVARVTAKCATPTTYDACDELNEVRRVKQGDPRAPSWDAVVKTAEPKVDELTWQTVGKGAACRTPMTSAACDSLGVYVGRHPGGRHVGEARRIIAGSAARIAQLAAMEAAAAEARREERNKWLSVCQAQCETTCSAWVDRSACMSQCTSNCENKIR